MLPSKENHPQIKKLLERDEDTFRLLYNSLFPKFSRFVKMNSGTYSDAEKVFQNALYQLIARAKVIGVSINSSFEEYIFTVCKNLWFKELDNRKNGVRNNQILDLRTETENQIFSILQQERYELTETTSEDLRIKIETYLGDTMSSDNQILEANPENEYTKKLRTYLLSEEAQEIKETLRNIQLERRVPQLRRKRRRLILISAAAALLFAVSVIGLMFQGEEGTEQLFAQYYSTNDLPSVITRDAASSKLSDGVLAFQSGEYADALAYFNNYETSTAEPDVALYLYRGVTYMEQEQFFKAIEEFELLIDSGSMDASKGFWFKAMAYLKAGDENNATHTLEDIANHIWYFKHEEAKELLKKLD